MYLLARCQQKWPNRLDLQNTLTAWGKTVSLSVLDMTLNNLKVELWGMWSTPLYPLLPGRLRTGVVAVNRVLSYGLHRTKH